MLAAESWHMSPVEVEKLPAKWLGRRATYLAAMRVFEERRAEEQRRGLGL